MRTDDSWLAELTRLDAVVRHLGISKKWAGPSMAEAVRDACLEQVRPVLKGKSPQGEIIAKTLASHYRVKIERVQCDSDFSRLKNDYVDGKGELGLLMVRDEFSSEDVDALLFLRKNAKPLDPDRWIAVLNLLYTRSREYWNIFHELVHRIIEPSQTLLPFRRNRLEIRTSIESLVDNVAAELAFYPPVFAPLVLVAAKSAPLSFDLIRKIQEQFAPSASLLATANAVVNHWPSPAIAITATMKGRKSNPSKDVALRVSLQGRNQRSRDMGLCPHPNMRIPRTSPIHESYLLRGACDGNENLEGWTTSDGGGLPAKRVFTSAVWTKRNVYGLISVA